jgi:hypothetical protein
VRVEPGIEALGKLSEAFEWVERARGRLYDFHQLMGHADFLMGDAADLFEKAGERELARRVRAEVVGRDVLEGRWTYQVVEEFDDTYYEPVRTVVRDARDRLADGRRHDFEAALKRARQRPPLTSITDPVA